ncbi:hypothetical protein AVEN_146564-1 [Araneus ventricosus]|uniref:Uncharacterized protein n=1 Tax=Araneus ventricosus TaxID=182803 RepID=A0A4Y2P1C5_ARAVE|nr:hypothetical protein AVEN_146564-1 [Araneus ventricosus]
MCWRGGGKALSLQRKSGQTGIRVFLGGGVGAEVDRIDLLRWVLCFAQSGPWMTYLNGWIENGMVWSANTSFAWSGVSDRD